VGSCLHISRLTLANFQIPNKKTKRRRYNPNQNIFTPPPKTPINTFKNDVTTLVMGGCILMDSFMVEDYLSVTVVWSVNLFPQQSSDNQIRNKNFHGRYR